MVGQRRDRTGGEISTGFDASNAQTDRRMDVRVTAKAKAKQRSVRPSGTPSSRKTILNYLDVTGNDHPPGPGLDPQVRIILYPWYVQDMTKR